MKLKMNLQLNSKKVIFHMFNKRSTEPNSNPNITTEPNSSQNVNTEQAKLKKVKRKNF